MIDMEVLKEEIIEEINNIITEEFGISDEVDSAVENIIKSTFDSSTEKFLFILDGKEFGSQEIYNVAISHLYSKNSIERSLATIIYASTRNEQDAIINGLYAVLKQNEKNEPLEITIENSEAIAWIKRLKDSYLIIKQNRAIDSYIKPYFAINHEYTYNKFLRTARHGIKDFEWKLARLIFGFKKRFIQEHHIRLKAPLNPSKNWMYTI